MGNIKISWLEIIDAVKELNDKVRELEKELEAGTQDPAYSSREITIEDIHKIHKEMSDKELKEGVYKSIIEELDNREGETPEEKAYRMGWINGYEEGVYDGENK
jgi:hypothetical protein